MTVQRFIPKGNPLGGSFKSDKAVILEMCRWMFARASREELIDMLMGFIETCDEETLRTIMDEAAVSKEPSNYYADRTPGSDGGTLS